MKKRKLHNKMDNTTEYLLILSKGLQYLISIVITQDYK